MKVIRYEAMGKTIVALAKEDGTYEDTAQDLLFGVERPYSEENEALAQQEAYDGTYTIEETAEPETPQTNAQRITELEEALAMLLSGVTE